LRHLFVKKSCHSFSGGTVTQVFFKEACLPVYLPLAWLAGMGQKEQDLVWLKCT